MTPCRYRRPHSKQLLLVNMLIELVWAPFSLDVRIRHDRPQPRSEASVDRNKRLNGGWRGAQGELEGEWESDDEENGAEGESLQAEFFSNVSNLEGLQKLQSAMSR